MHSGPPPRPPLGHCDRAHLEHLLGLVPRAQPRGLIPAEDPEQLVLRPLLLQGLQRVDRVRRSLPPRLQGRHPKPLVVRDRRLAQLDPYICARVVADLPMRRLPHRHEQNRLELQPDKGLLRQHQMSDVRRIERSAQDAETQAG